ncbi:hypothetical protein C824_006147 [Schaedlerella arabinosiphila]|nr:hypothetical protein C824_006147 [Schaedlerella arabinosiphila]
MPMLRAVIYCRCSTEEESQQDALIQQVQESRKSVQQQGWLLVDEYIEAKSGTTTAKRKEYNRLFEELQTDKFDIVQIKTQDRLMRNTRDWYLFIDRLVSNGKRLYMYLERKFYSADDALITGIKAILAEEYSKELSKKINNAHYHRQEDGRKFILPPNTFGLQRLENGEIVLVEEEVSAIRIMFHLCKTMGCSSIEHYLEEEGIRDRNGKPFKEEAIRRIIRNPIRCGTVIQNKVHFDFQLKRTVKVPKEQWVIHKNVLPAVVSEAEWKEANDAMDARALERNVKEYHPGGKNPGKYRLSGKIRCGECGSPFYRTYRKRYKDEKLIVEWKCQKYLQNGRNSQKKMRSSQRKVKRTSDRGCDNIHLDEENLNLLLEKVCAEYYQGAGVEDSEIIDKALAILNGVLQKNDTSSRQNRVCKELEKYEAQEKKLLDKLLADVISDQDYKIKKEEITAKIDGLKKDLENLQDTENARLVTEQRLKVIRKRLEEDTVRQATLSDMIDSIDMIKVYPERLELSFQAEKVLGVDTSALANIKNISDDFEKKLTLEVPLHEEFLYSTRKEAESRRIIEYIQQNPKVTAKQIAGMEGISLSTANARIRKLKKQGKIHYEGHGGRGKWVIDKT